MPTFAVGPGGSQQYHHGFCFPERAVYDTLAGEETWSKIFAMWDRRLK